MNYTAYINIYEYTAYIIFSKLLHYTIANLDGANFTKIESYYTHFNIKDFIQIIF